MEYDGDGDYGGGDDDPGIQAVCHMCKHEADYYDFRDDGECPECGSTEWGRAD